MLVIQSHTIKLRDSVSKQIGLHHHHYLIYSCLHDTQRTPVILYTFCLKSSFHNFLHARAHTCTHAYELFYQKPEVGLV